MNRISIFFFFTCDLNRDLSLLVQYHFDLSALCSVSLIEIYFELVNSLSSLIFYFN